MKECRVVLLGCGGVGKSALAIRFATGEFINCYDPTIEDFYRHSVVVEGLGTVSLEVLDTAGTGQYYNNNRNLYITSGHVFGLVYSVDSRKSLDSLYDLYRDIIQMRRSTSSPIIIIGTKCDIEVASRQVAIEDVRNMVRKTWGVSKRDTPIVIETSAKEGKNVEEMFQHMARLSMQTMMRTLPRMKSSTLPALASSPDKTPKHRSTQSLGMPPSRASVVSMGSLSAAPSPKRSPESSQKSTLASVRSYRRPVRSSWRDRFCVIM